MEFEEERAPQVISMRNLMLAFGLHVAAFLLLWLFSIFHFKEKETVIPIELVFEAPPDEVAPEEVKPPPPQPKPVVKPPEPPPEVDDDVDAVIKIKDDKKKPEKKKPEPPKEKPKPPEPKPEKPKEKPKPEKTKEQIKKEKEAARKKRLEDIRNRAKDVKVVTNPKPPPVVGTGKNLAKEWEKLANQGYKPGDHTELARDEKQRCISLIKAAFYEKWDRPPWTDTLRKMELRVFFGPGGRVVSYKLTKGSSDPKADLTVVNAAKAVRYVRGLSESFISTTKSEGVIIRFDVTPQ